MRKMKRIEFNSKKLVRQAAAALSAAAVFGIAASAFDFPEPDWGAILAEREVMVNEVDLDLYTEDAVDSAPYYGAKLEPRGGVYLGMVTENSEQFAPVGSYLTYIDRMIPWIYIPANRMIRDGNSIATVALNIRDTNVDYSRARRVFDYLAGYNKPMLIRVAGEMSEFQIGEDPEKFIEIFRNLANMIHEYENLAVVWSPLDLGNLTRPYHYYYPGDEYVDWVGVSSYAIKYFQGNPDTSYVDSVYFMTGDNAWITNRIKPFMKFLDENNIKKPVMLSECGIATENQQGEDLTSWASPRFRDLFWSVIMKYPQVKLINYFNSKTYEHHTFYISDREYVKNIYDPAASSGAYIRELGGTAQFVFSRVGDAKAVRIRNGRLPLYALAHIPGEPETAVTYSVDGVRVAEPHEIPYKYELELAMLSDGEHSISIEADGYKKEYKLNKSGEDIRFIKAPQAFISGSCILFSIGGKYDAYGSIVSDGSGIRTIYIS